MVVNSNGMYYGAVSTSAFAGDDLFLTTESVRLTCCFNDPFPFIGLDCVGVVGALVLVDWRPC